MISKWEGLRDAPVPAHKNLRRCLGIARWELYHPIQPAAMKRGSSSSVVVCHHDWGIAAHVRGSPAPLQPKRSCTSRMRVVALSCMSHVRSPGLDKRLASLTASARRSTLVPRRALSLMGRRLKRLHLSRAPPRCRPLQRPSAEGRFTQVRCRSDDLPRPFGLRPIVSLLGRTGGD